MIINILRFVLSITFTLQNMNGKYVVFLLAGIFYSVESNGTTYTTVNMMTTEQFQTTEGETTMAPTELTTTIPPSGFSCVPETDCSRAAAGALVPDPIDCERYYVCINVGGEPVPASSPSSCPQGQYFNGTVGGCVAESFPGICTSTCGADVCSDTCPVSPSTTTIVADSTDCSIYIICLESGAFIPSACPNDAPYFNGIICVSDATQCCSCRPHCTAPGTEIQDPCDCSSYYICSDIGQPHVNNRGTCPPGSYFDESQVGCFTGNCANSCSTCA